MRAMEEEDMRMTMHGSGKHFYGAGATPSMGLSQYRGGGTKKGMTRKTARKAYESESEEEMEGGQIGRLISRIIPRATARVAPTSTAIVPYVPRVTARPTSTAIIPLGSAGRPIARPALSARQYGRMFQQRPSASPFVSTSARQLVGRLGSRFGPTLARVGALGTAVGAVGSYLGDQFGQDTGDVGYFDDYAGEEYIYEPPTTGEYAPEGLPLIPAEGTVPDGLSPDELAWYLQSGNLPTRYTKPRRGKGKLDIEITHEGMDKKGAGIVEVLAERMREAKEGKKKDQTTAKKRDVKLPSYLEGMMKPQQATYRDLEFGLREQAKKQMEEQQKRMAETMKKKRESAIASKKGSGKKVSARAEIVRRVMHERGVSLPQASRIVKEEGLY